MTAQLEAWRGAFGAAYIRRNEASAETVRLRVSAWARILERAAPRSILEVGPNIGLNLRALPGVTGAELFGAEPNAEARARLIEDGVLAPDRVVEAHAGALPFPDGRFDLVFTSGVLIHVAPEHLERATDEIVRVSSRFVVAIEYFATDPEEKTYRGERGLLFKRDFGGWYMDRYPQLDLRDHGFFWRRTSGLDDVHWQLFEKRS